MVFIYLVRLFQKQIGVGELEFLLKVVTQKEIVDVDGDFSEWPNKLTWYLLKEASGFPG